MLLFIYFPRAVATRKARFNTSHVTLYLIPTVIICNQFLGFNTSHVTLYPNGVSDSPLPFHVSIHLMLLFIIFVVEASIAALSVSIHLMLLFI